MVNEKPIHQHYYAASNATEAGNSNLIAEVVIERAMEAGPIGRSLGHLQKPRGQTNGAICWPGGEGSVRKESSNLLPR